MSDTGSLLGEEARVGQEDPGKNGKKLKGDKNEKIALLGMQFRVLLLFKVPFKFQQCF